MPEARIQTANAGRAQGTFGIGRRLTVASALIVLLFAALALLELLREQVLDLLGPLAVALRDVRSLPVVVGRAHACGARGYGAALRARPAA